MYRFTQSDIIIGNTQILTVKLGYRWIFLLLIVDVGILVVLMIVKR